MIDGDGMIHGPFRDLAAIKAFPRQPEPVTLLHVDPGEEGPMFLRAGDALAEAMDAIIFKTGADDQSAFNTKVRWSHTGAGQ